MIQEKTVGTRTLEQLLAESRPAAKGDDPGATVRELCDALGMRENTVRERLRRLQGEGRLAVGRAMRPTLAGARLPVPVYRLSDPAPGKKRKR